MFNSALFASAISAIFLCITITQVSGNNCQKKPKCNEPNEYFEKCVNTTVQTCEFINKQGNFSPVHKGCCRSACRCIANYLRNREGRCIPASKKRCTTTTTTVAPLNGNESYSALDKLWEANADFTGKFLYFKVKESPTTSFIASPLSVLVPLAELALYADGTSLDQLTRVLNLSDKDDIREGFRNLLDTFKIQKNITLILGQRVYSNIQYELSYEFKVDTRDYFDAEAQNLDFADSANAATTINDWVNNKTNGLIPNIVDESTLNLNTRLVLVNVIYFKGDWLRPFNPDNTQEKPFYISKDETTTVNMMYQEDTFRYVEDTTLQIKAVELLYKDTDYSLLCLLPTSNDTYSLDSLAEKLQDQNTLKSIVNNMTYQKVRVYLPSITTSTSTDLTKIFEQTNVTKILDPYDSGLSGILKNPEDLYVSSALQKAFVVINELGSEAAAANVVVVGVTSVNIQPPAIFEAKRPFFYFIMYELNILFCGSYTGD